MADESAPAPATNEEAISIKVVSQQGDEVVFKIKKRTALKKMMDAYCSRQGVGSNAVKFLFEGQRINGDQTPADLGIGDNEQIDVVLEQTGGSQ